jgi:hypothetical protein
MDGLQWHWSRRRFSRVRFSPMKWCAKHGPIILNAADRLVGLKQFVLLIQQVQAPEDIAALPPMPSPQAAPTTQPPPQPPNAPPTSNTINGQGTNASTAPSTPNTSRQQPPGQGVPWVSVLRFILQLVWYDEHNRICTPASLLSPPLFA